MTVDASQARLAADSYSGRRVALRYYGGKWGSHGRVADWVINHFPPHDCYVEPFAGALSVLLRKPRSKIEFANDADGRIVNFFRVLRDEPAALVERIRLTPHARAELDLSNAIADDPLEDARRVYVRSLQGRGGAARACNPGWRYEVRPVRGSRLIREWRGLDHLYEIADRLLEVHLECGDALEIIPRLDRPATLFYIDPPYLASTRTHRWSRHAYRHEFSTEEEHRRLAEVLLAAEGIVVLSGYASELYLDLYGDWTTSELVSTKDGGKAGLEILWLNAAAAAALGRSS